MTHYYNEFAPKTAAWLRELIKQGLISRGIVDERSITEITPSDLRGFTQCHFFSGIGGWSLALKLAGWPEDRPVWTGSCPCQPFSNAGKQLAENDARHLWPAFFNLIRECRPVTVFGEQVGSAIGKGWLDGISADLESEGYTCGAVVLGAHSVGAPHIRQRLYWVADSNNGAGFGKIGGSERKACRETAGVRQNVTRAGEFGGTSDHVCSGAWNSYDTLFCRDGKARRVESGTCPLAHGVSARLGRLCGYGNAIVPQVAAEFIAAYLELPQ